MERKISLNQITVKTPCHADWDAMSGDDQKRFCSHCNKHVHNLSEMTRIAAEKLICQNAGRLCVQYRRDDIGRIITLDYAPTVPAKWWTRWAPLAIVVSITSSAMAWVSLTNNVTTPPVMGKIAPMVQNNPVVKGEMVERGDVMIIPPPATQPATQPTTKPADQ